MAKDQEEKWIFDNFKMLYNNFPECNIDDKGESPDFVLKTISGNIGIELTKLYWEQNNNEQTIFQEQESLQSKVSELLLNKLDTSNLKPTYIGLSILDKVKLTKKNIIVLVDCIFDFISENQPDDGQTLKFDEFEDTEILYDFIQFIRISHVRNNDMFDVCIPSTAWIPSLKDCDLKRVIDKKELKIHKYLKRADSLWLLISIDTSSLATFYKGTETMSILKTEFSTKFDKVFVISVNRGKLMELNIKKIDCF